MGQFHALHHFVLSPSTAGARYPNGEETAFAEAFL
jgi:hypothetical protein